ncbi:MAG TPA: EthD domain-containing protein [Caulobacteraceae bacterium]|nr:EthD domain-containing protein [Caulobacteraceae bacterium]
MVKVMIFLTRKDGMGRQDFAAWWLGPHRAMAERLEGLRRMCFNLLPEGGPCDAVVEQWFDDEAAAERCYQTRLGREVAADSAAHVSARQRLVVEAHEFSVS